MTRRILLAALLVLSATPLFAGDFSAVVSALERGTNMKRTWIPFFGVARTFVRATGMEGVHDVQLAVYEGTGTRDWNALEKAFRTAAGNDYRPFVTTKERNGENVVILAKPHGKLLDLLIFTQDSEDTVLVRVVVDPEEADDIASGHEFR